MNTSAPMSPLPAPGAGIGFLLEEGKRLSESLIWQLNRQYYADSGANAWNSGAVPFYATCNPYIAQAYSHVILSYLRDARAAGLVDPDQPIYIVELAAGVGRFAYQFLKKLHALKAASSLAKLDLRYVMTDFTSSNIKSWQAQKLFAPFVSAGLLDFGAFDAERDREIVLAGGQTLSEKTVKNPIVVVANYAFDTFRHDVFHVVNGVLNEMQISLRSPQQLAVDLNQLKVQYTDRAVGPDYYDDPVLNEILARYRDELGEASFPFPIGGFLALRSLAAMAGGRLLLLASDKGITAEDGLYYGNLHGMSFHTGCLSMMVNFHAMGQYVTKKGGVYLASSARDINLKTAACILGGAPAQFTDTAQTFNERIDVFGPSDFFELLQQERQNCKSMTVEHFLGLLRMSHWDPQLTMQYARDLVPLVPTVTETVQFELRLALERVWENFYPGSHNLPFEMARLFLAMKRPAEALRFNRYSLELFGEHATTYFNIGICCYHAEDMEGSRAAFRRAQELDPTFGPTKAWLARLEGEMSRGAPPPAR